MAKMNVIEVKNMGKKFKLRHVKGETLKATMIDRILGRESMEDFWALHNLTFEVAQGEVLGIIGPNGGGKTTLLSILAQTMVPTVGEVKVRGKVSSLLELGAGFHPDLTGRENIYLKASIMGIPRSVINEKFRKIVEFSGLGHFIETPIKFYSSGMNVRLGFSVAVAVDPQILLIDEVLAVGDEEFQRKSGKRIEQFKEVGKTIVLVSHSMNAIRDFCDQAIYLDRGEIVKMGPADKVVETYLYSTHVHPPRSRTEPELALPIDHFDFGEHSTSKEFILLNIGGGELNWAITSEESWVRIKPRAGSGDDTVTVSVNRATAEPGKHTGHLRIKSNGGSRNISVQMEVPEPVVDHLPGESYEYGNREAEITGAQLFNQRGEKTTCFRTEEEMVVKITFLAHRKIEKPVFGFSIHDNRGNIPTLCFGTNTQLEGVEIPHIEGEGKITLRLGLQNLLSGDYFLSLSIHSEDHLTHYHRQDFCYTFSLESSHSGLGITQLPVKWSLE
jgi:ABC-type polysaccharide/polyol phosphate transport system ATPase subunit